MSALIRWYSDLDLSQCYFQSKFITKGCMVAVGAYGIYRSVDVIYGQYCRRLFDRKRDEKRRENQRSIQALRERLNQDPLSDSEVQRITRLSLNNLITELKTGKIRPIEALKAFQTQALRAHQKTNCLVEIITEAEERALSLEKGPREGLLWGVPISIKDDVGLKGYENTVGMAVRIGITAQKNGTILEVLLQHGAVPFVKTNVPQSEMSIEPGNPINGTVHNPHAHGRGPGGSSSGEAALIASGGSPLGIGSDIAGSIRVPAHFCGIKGFKPTPDRISIQHQAFDGPGAINTVVGTWGPLSREVDGLVLLTRCLWENSLLSEKDNTVPPLPFNFKEYESKRKLKIGYFTENPLFPTFSACKRAVSETVDKLRQEGHEVVAWAPPRMDEANKLGWAHLDIIYASFEEPLKHDVIDPTLHDLSLIRRPGFIRKAFGVISGNLNPRGVGLPNLHLRSLTYDEFITMSHEVIKLRRTVVDAWMKEGLDAVICPPNIMVSPPLGSADLLNNNWIYTFYFNVVNYPSGVVHATNVIQADIDNLDSDYPDVKNTSHQRAKKLMQSSLNLPVGVMVSTPKYRDETCLRVMKIIEEGVRKSD